MPKPSSFKTFVGKRVRPLSPDDLRSEIIQESGYAIEVVKGGGDGTRLYVAGADQDPFSEEAVGARSIACRPGAMLIGEFARCGVRWSDIGLSSVAQTTREVELKIYREKAAARVELVGADLLQAERKHLKTNSHTLMGGNLASNESHVVFDTIGYEIPRDDVVINPGKGVPHRSDEGFLELVIGASAASGVGTSLTQPPRILIYAYMQHSNLIGQRILWTVLPMLELPLASSGLPGTTGKYATSWRYSTNAMAINSGLATANAIGLRIPCPPNGFRVEIWNPQENAAEDLQWSGYVFTRGQ